VTTRNDRFYLAPTEAYFDKSIEVGYFFYKSPNQEEERQEEVKPHPTRLNIVSNKRLLLMKKIGLYFENSV
jgi:hypothetical protein